MEKHAQKKQPAIHLIAEEADALTNQPRLRVVKIAQQAQDG